MTTCCPRGAVFIGGKLRARGVAAVLGINLTR